MIGLTIVSQLSGTAGGAGTYQLSAAPSGGNRVCLHTFKPKKKFYFYFRWRICMSFRRAHVLVLALIIPGALTATTFAQAVGSIRGTVVDTASALIPGAQVTLTSAAHSRRGVIAPGGAVPARINRRNRRCRASLRP